MTVKLSMSSNNWHFTKGIFVAHTVALYNPDQNLLKVVDVKHLSSVVKLLFRYTDKQRITLEFIP